ncbi:MAG: NYN domain-containing protein [Gammaproteobacteria bacterium]|nr:NYN domain-containing protein [Gammaproteobacteria bacterium]
MQRVFVYIDDFNLYFGLKSKGWKRYYWLNLARLAENLLKPSQNLAMIRYFTSRISTNSVSPGKDKRQATYLEALQTLPDFHIHYGHYLPKKRKCAACGATWETHEEKMTDVNIAVRLLGDAQDNRFDTAIIISGDSDLVPPISDLRNRYPKKNVIVAFPPSRTSQQLRKIAAASFHIGRDKFHHSQFPDRVTKADGYVLERPREWY